MLPLPRFALAEYLLSVLKKSDKAAAVCSCVSAFIAFLIYSDNLIFVLCFAVIFAVDKFGAGKYFRHIGAVSVLLVLFIVKPPFIDVLILIIMLVAFTVTHITAGQLIKCREQLAENREETVSLNRRIASLEEYAKTAKKSAAVEERRRFSARIHDKLARIEVLPEEIERVTQPDIRKKINDGFRECGFAYVTLDLAGYRTGSMNETLEKK